MAKKAPTKESRRFIPVSVKDVERHCERCAPLPHRIVKDVKAFLQKKKPFLLEKRDLRLSGFRLGGAHIFHNVFQHLSQKQE